MLQYYLFGNNFNKVEQYKIKRTPQTFLFHIASMEIAKQIFNIGDLCLVEVYINNNNNNNMIWYSCCGKVIIRNLDSDTEIGGYILEETNTRWKVQLDDNCTVYILIPIHNKNTNSWIFPHQIINNVSYSILEYSPICILISKAGYISYTMNRLVCCIRGRNRIELVPGMST